MALALSPIPYRHAFGDNADGRLCTPPADSISLASGLGFRRVPCPQNRATMRMKTEDMTSQTPSGFDAATPEAEPASSKCQYRLKIPHYSV
jgi:hypothetical protein